MDVVRIVAFYALRDRQHDGVVDGVAPRLEIVAVHPDDIRNISVAIAEVSPKSLRFLWAVRFEGGEPAVRLDRVKQQSDAVCCRYLQHVIDPLKVLGVWC